MLKEWLIGFSAGSLWGRYTHTVMIRLTVLHLALGWWAALGVLLFSLRSWKIHYRWFKQIRSAMVLTGGLVWGLSHAAPAPIHALRDVVVLSEGDGQRGLLVAKADEVTETVGQAPVGSRGSVRLLHGDPLFPRSRFKPRFQPAAYRPSLMHVFFMQCRSFLSRRLASLPEPQSAWLQGVILGDKSAVPTELKAAFKRSGTAHLLVVNGLHVGLVAHLVGLFLVFPGRVLYALGLLSPRAWERLAALMKVTAAAAALLFAGIAGLSHATQRAALIYVVLQLSLVFTGALALRHRLLVALDLQSCFFPVGFFGVETLLSWGAYLLVLGLFQMKQRRWRRLLTLQLQLCLLVGACLGQISLVGILANMVVIPLFPLILAGALPLFFSAVLHSRWGVVLLTIQAWFLRLIEFFGGLSQRWSWLCFTIHGWARFAVLVAVSILLLNSLRRLTIKNEGFAKRAAEPKVPLRQRLGSRCHAAKSHLVR